jgi:Family of unknown function (DUF6356)
MQNHSLISQVNRAFSEHPAAVGETYSEHLVTAGGFGWALLKASLACFVHAVLPFAFEKTGSFAITELHARMVSNRHRVHAK